MVKFYLNMLRKKLPQDRQEYLNTTVMEMFRDEVKTQWNALHPDEKLK